MFCIGYKYYIDKCERKISAVLLTDNHFNLGPLIFNNDIYFPSSFDSKNDFPEERNTESLGNVVSLTYNKLLLPFLNHYIIGDRADSTNMHIKTVGDDSTGYTKAQLLESKEVMDKNLETYSNFVLCYEEGEKSFSYKY